MSAQPTRTGAGGAPSDSVESSDPREHAAAADLSDAAVDAVVVVAMPDEAEPFLSRAADVGPETVVGGAVLRPIGLAGRRVLLVRGGIGLVNAASAATAAFVLQGTTAGRGTTPGRSTTAAGVPVLVSAGSAGGLGAEVRVGDVVVGTRHTYTDADARAFGYARGQVPGMPEAYDGDPALVAAALGAAGSVGLTARAGLMLSGDSFVDAGLVDRVRATFDGALSTDMESTALAQVAHRHGARFLAVRGISDLCGPVADEDFLTHVDDAADRSAGVVEAVLAAAPAGV